MGMTIRFVTVNLMLIALLTASAAQDVAPASPLSATTPGYYPLKRPSVGDEKTTVLAGFYQKLEHARTCSVQLDLLTITDTSWRRVPVGTRVLSQRIRQTTNGWQHTNLHYYRQSLPTDEQIKACATVSNLVQLIGEPDWAEGAPYSAGWAVFTITSTNTVETLSIHCGAERWTADKIPIEALEVQRGAIREQNPASPKPTERGGVDARCAVSSAFGHAWPGRSRCMPDASGEPCLTSFVRQQIAYEE
jgi:hypothetical protein